MNILITICARGGSKGIPGKNIKPLNGHPLIAYTIQVAQQFAAIYNGHIALSTDSAEIKEVAANYGVVTDYERPKALSSDNAGKIDTIRNLVLYEEQRNSVQYDCILDLDVTSPLRTLDDLLNGFKLLTQDPQSLNLFSVNNASRNPYFNMVEKKENNYYGIVKSGGEVLSRQSAPAVYELNASFYFYKRDFFTQNSKTVFTGRSLIYLMPHICFDLDHTLDFEFLDFLLQHNKLGFQIWTS